MTGSRFLRFTVEATNTHVDFAPGKRTINGLEAEPFDLSAAHLYFPIHELSDSTLEVKFEMDDFVSFTLQIKAVDLLLENGDKNNI